MALNRQSAAVLRYAIAQGAADKKLRSELSISKAALAKAAGISPRSLGRYLSGERKPPADVHLRLMSVAQDVRAELSAKFRAEAKAAELPYPATKIPVRVARYKRASSFLPTVGRSEIIEVDTRGMDESEFLDLLRTYHRELSTTGRNWDIRLLVKVKVTDYFGEDGPQNEEVKASLRGRSYVPIWVPPAPFIFVRAKGSFKDADADEMIRLLRETLNAPGSARRKSYIGRLPSEGGFLKVAFIPYKTDDERKQAKRKRGRSAALGKKRGRRR